MQQSRSRPARPDRPVGRSSPSWRPPAAAPPRRPPRAPQPRAAQRRRRGRHADPAAGRHPAAARRRMRPAPTAASSSAGSSASAPAPSPSSSRPRREFVNDVQRVAEGRLHLAGDPRTTTSPRRQLKTQIAAGNAPDIIGPVGVEGLNLFRDQLLDLAPLIATTSYTSARRRPEARRLLQARRGRRHDRPAVRGLPVVPVLQQGPLRRGRAALPADQGRRLVPGQAVGHGRGPHPRHEADRRQERQRRHERELRPDEHRPVGLRHAVRRQQPAGRDVAVRRRARSSPPTARPPRSRRHVATGEKWYNDGVWKDHFIPSASPDQQRPARQGQRVRVGQPRDERVAHLVHVLRLPGRAGQAEGQVLRLGDRPVLQRRRPPPSSTPTRSACSRRPRSRTRPSRP